MINSNWTGSEQPVIDTPSHSPARLLHVLLPAIMPGACRPARADWVALVGETFGDAAVRAMAQRMRASPTGQQILAERPRVTVRSRLERHVASKWLLGCV